MSDVGVALGAAFGASILTTIGSRWIVGVQTKKAAEQQQVRSKHEAAQARVADERSLRDAKRERLRGDLVAISLAADTIHHVGMELVTLFRGETEESRDERLNETLKTATENLAAPMMRLRLEEGTQPLLDSFQSIRSLWFLYADWDVPRAKESGDYQEAIDTITKISAQSSSVLVEAKSQLDALSQPM
jgi:hypothetical protein